MKRHLLAVAVALAAPAMAYAQKAEPLVIGETIEIESKALGEKRRINVYAPAAFIDTSKTALPVMYMPDGGIGEDFLHVAGLIQIGASNGTTRPFLLVGIENTQRRRDLTGPTQDPEDRKIAPAVGGSAAYRAFIRDELMPLIHSRYRTTRETAIVGESLAGYFVVETFMLEPKLFDTYIAFDPSLWWNQSELVKRARERLAARSGTSNTLYLAASAEPEIAALTQQLADILKAGKYKALAWQYHPMPAEKHSTIYHTAALQAFRLLFAPPPEK
jgi:uncharacterized protein